MKVLIILFYLLSPSVFTKEKVSDQSSHLLKKAHTAFLAKDYKLVIQLLSNPLLKSHPSALYLRGRVEKKREKGNEALALLMFYKNSKSHPPSKKAYFEQSKSLMKSYRQSFQGNLQQLNPLLERLFQFDNDAIAEWLNLLKNSNLIKDSEQLYAHWLAVAKINKSPCLLTFKAFRILEVKGENGFLEFESYLSKAAELGDSTARFHLAMNSWNYRGDLQSMIENLALCSDSGHHQCTIELAKIYSTDFFNQLDQERVIEILNPFLEKNDPEAHLVMAKMYWFLEETDKMKPHLDISVMAQLPLALEFVEEIELERQEDKEPFND